MIYGVTIKPESGTAKHTYTDWHLLQIGAAYVSPPEPKTMVEDIPGADGSLDFTEALTGTVHYKNREFHGRYRYIGARSSWKSAQSQIYKSIQGKQCRVIFDDDQGYFYVGRMSVSEVSHSKLYWEIEITGDMEPYKYGLDTTRDQDWLWNDLFNTTIYYGTFDVNGIMNRNMINPSGQSLKPEITCSQPMVVDFNNETYRLPKGKSKQITLIPGNNIMVFSGFGRVNVDYSLVKSL